MANRTTGESKLALQEMGCRYLFIVLYVFLEHHLSRGDYRHPGAQHAAPPRHTAGAGAAGAASREAGGR